MFAVVVLRLRKNTLLIYIIKINKIFDVFVQELKHVSLVRLFSHFKHQKTTWRRGKHSKKKKKKKRWHQANTEHSNKITYPLCHLSLFFATQDLWKKERKKKNILWAKIKKKDEVRWRRWREFCGKKKMKPWRKA